MSHSNVEIGVGNWTDKEVAIPTLPAADQRVEGKAETILQRCGDQEASKEWKGVSVGVPSIIFQ